MLFLSLRRKCLRQLRTGFRQTVVGAEAPQLGTGEKIALLPASEMNPKARQLGEETPADLSSTICYAADVAMKMHRSLRSLPELTHLFCRSICLEAR